MDLILPGSLHLTTSGADFIEAQRSRFSELVIQADRIAITGVRVRPWVKPTQPPQGAAQAHNTGLQISPHLSPTLKMAVSFPFSLPINPLSFRLAQPLLQCGTLASRW